MPLFFVGIGDDHEVRDLRLHDLQVEDVIYVNDKANFEARLTGQGFKDLTLPVVLKVREKDDKDERELARKMVKVDRAGTNREDSAATPAQGSRPQALHHRGRAAQGGPARQAPRPGQSPPGAARSK